MAKKEFKYRGLSLSELQALSTKEFMELLPSRARRSLKRGNSHSQQKFMDKLEAGKSKLKTHCRDIVIVPSMVGKTVEIHNGKDFVQVELKADMIGTFFGEYALTRRKANHTVGKKKK